MTLPIEYIDSSILVAYAIGPRDRFYTTARDIFENRIMGDQMTGLVSMLTILELIDVVKHRVTEGTDKTILDAIDDSLRQSYMKAQCEKKIKAIIEALTQMEEQEQIIFADFTTIDLRKIMEDAYNYSKAYFGVIMKFYRCKICRNPLESYSYKGLGWIDVMHAFLASELCADGLTTADKSFADISLDPKFSGLRITII